MFPLQKTLSKIKTLREGGEKIQFLASSFAFKQLVAMNFLTAFLEKKASYSKVVFLCSTEKEARKWSDFFSFYKKQIQKKYEIEELFATPYWDLLKAHEHESTRFRSLKALNFLQDPSKKGVLISTPEGLLQKIFEKDSYEKESFTLFEGMEEDPSSLEEKLKALGYREATYVREKGFFAMRGGVFDIFPVTSEVPVRLEFFGSEVQSLRSFEGATGKTLEELSSAKISPCANVFLAEEERKPLYQKFYNFLEEKGLAEKHKLDLLRRLKSENYLLQFERVLPSLLKSSFSENVDLIGSDTFLVCLDSPFEIEDAYLKTLEGLVLVYEALSEYEEVLSSPRDHFFPEKKLISFLESHGKLVFTKHDTEPQASQFLPDEGWKSFPLLKQAIQKRPSSPLEVLEHLLTAVDHDYQVVLLFSSEKDERFFAEVLKERSLSYKVLEHSFLEEISDIFSEKYKAFSFLLMRGKIEGAFIAELEKKILCDGSLLLPNRSSSKKKSPRKIFSREEFTAGDYVIHELHGIGRYEGLKEVGVGGGFFDFLKLTYKNDAVLYVPMDRFELLRKYEKGEGGSSRVALDKLGGTSWKLRKKKVEENIRKLASGLLQLEAARKLAGLPLMLLLE